MGKPVINVPIRFQPKSYVRHVATGKIYQIKFGPEGKLACRIEKDNTPAYAYQRVQRKGEKCTATELGVLWVRAAAIMEKNFVAAPEITYADIYGVDLAAQVM